MEIILSAIIWILIFIAIFFYFKSKDVKIKNEEIIVENQKNEIKRKELLQICDNLNNQIKIISAEKDNENEKLYHLQAKTADCIEKQKEIINNSFQNYCVILDNQYEKKDIEFYNKIQQLDYNYNKQKNELDIQLKTIQNELDNMKKMRDSLIEASRREKEIQEQLSFYCLKASDKDLEDIKKLEKVKKDLNNPRILSMLIWSTYWQKPMTTLCNNIIGTSVKTGIYKITNQKNNMCYIGQASDLASRWKQHAKCGLGIDTPQGNKLYKAMIEDGIWNFSWEVLEECDRSQLNEKEKFYIDLYDSYNFGYNSSRGVGVN